MNKEIKNIFVADDWGLSKEINDAILYLVNKNLILRVSIMAETQYTNYRLDELLKSGVRTSFHFNLTFGEKMSSLSKIFLTNESKKIEDQFHQQLNSLKSNGITVDSLESHQYVHCIPSVARLIAPWCKENLLFNIRVHSDRRHLLATCFSYYSFKKIYKLEQGFKPLFTREFQSSSLSNDHPMVIHPATNDSYDVRDTWRKKRVNEFNKIKQSFSL